MNRPSLAAHRARLGFAGCLIILAFMAAPGATGDVRSALAQPDGTTQVSFVNGTPDGPSVDVYVDGVRQIEDLAFGQASAVIEVAAGPRTVAVTPTGEDVAGAIVESGLTLERGGAYVIANVDLLENVALRSWRINLEPVAGDGTRLRVIHASPDAPAVDVAVAGGDVLIAGATFNHAPAAVEVAPGTFDFQMRPAGSTDVVQTIPDVTVPADTACTVIAVGLLGDDGALDIVAIFNPLNLVRTGGIPSTGTGAAALADGPLGGSRPLLIALASLCLLVAAGAAADRRARTTRAPRR